jgi:hypothetical protein
MCACMSYLPIQIKATFIYQAFETPGAMYVCMGFVHANAMQCNAMVFTHLYSLDLFCSTSKLSPPCKCNAMQCNGIPFPAGRCASFLNSLQTGCCLIRWWRKLSAGRPTQKTNEWCPSRTFTFPCYAVADHRCRRRRACLSMHASSRNNATARRAITIFSATICEAQRFRTIDAL